MVGIFHGYVGHNQRVSSLDVSTKHVESTEHPSQNVLVGSTMVDQFVVMVKLNSSLFLPVSSMLSSLGYKARA